ncbi:uncharacterized protein LOC117175626 [Belonocnema kinseyi]|uniref:uncharacterized protein LOC117175626 n=1 Tax=Belonocnema kinseyi TaxID=2817044 RepID=UPI00143CD05F|nr:uncharacterized protein LOC117175626 [Belonocnema kinseyi]
MTSNAKHIQYFLALENGFEAIVDAKLAAKWQTYLDRRDHRTGVPRGPRPAILGHKDTLHRGRYSAIVGIFEIMGTGLTLRFVNEFVLKPEGPMDGDVVKRKNHPLAGYFHGMYYTWPTKPAHVTFFL